MGKCEHPTCDWMGDHGFCAGHRSLLLSDKHCTVLCWNCGNLVKIISNVPKKRQKYVFVVKCRKCGGTKEDERTLESFDNKDKEE